MFRYILKRLLYFIPTLFAISLLTFMLSKIAPGDPVELKLKGGMGAANNGQSDKLAGEKAYMEIREKLGLNQPNFYFSLTSKAYPDTLYKVVRQSDRENLERLIDKYGNWPRVQEYYLSLRDMQTATATVHADSNSYTKLRTVREGLNDLLASYDTLTVNRLLINIDKAVKAKIAILADSSGGAKTLQPLKNLVASNTRLMAAHDSMVTLTTTNLKYIPSMHWYGLHNQYHRWLFGDAPWFSADPHPSTSCRGFFRLDFGESYLDGRPVLSIMKDAIFWTLLLNTISILLSYIIAIPIGIESAVKKDTMFDRVTTTILFVFYSLPSFWIATILIVFFTNSEYHMNLFPTYGVASPDMPADASFIKKFLDSGYHFILPVFCLTYSSFAFISRQMRGAMVSVIRQDYIRTANAKGLDKIKVIWKHAFRNSLIPLITMFASLFPLMISGSVIIEYIFSIPGMGRVSYESEVARNYPVLFTILMFSAILTMVGMLVADLLYAVVDPRISYTKKS